jgi:hypothetical protein
LRGLTTSWRQDFTGSKNRVKLCSTTMSLLNSLSGAALRQAANIKDKIQALEKELLTVLKNTTIAVSASSSEPVKKKGGMSAAGKAKIAAAQKRRWAKVKAQAKTAGKTPAKKGGMSAAGRAKIAAAAKARWAKAKAAGKKAL